MALAERYDITVLLAMVTGQPGLKSFRLFESALQLRSSLRVSCPPLLAERLFKGNMF